MRPVRSGGGGFFPSFNVQTMAAKLAISLVASSIVAQLLSVLPLALFPGMVLHQFTVWQLFTYAFLEGSPMGIIFGALILWSLGTALEMGWGSKRLLTFALGVTVTSGALTVLLALVVPALMGGMFYGGMVMTTAMWVAFGWSQGRAQTNFWGMPLSGNALAVVGMGFVVLNGLFGSWLSVIPELFGIGLTYLYVRQGSPRLWLLRFQSWRLQQRLKGRSKHLRVIGKDRNVRGDSDRFLH